MLPLSGLFYHEVAINPCELISAVHNWLRTVEIFLGYLRFMLDAEKKSGTDTRSKDPLVDGLVKTPGPPPPAKWNDDDALRREILLKAQCRKPFNIGDLRAELKSKSRWRSASGGSLSSFLNIQVKALQEKGLMIRSEAPAEESDADKKRTAWVRSAHWANMGPDARADADRLQFNEAHFQ